MMALQGNTLVPLVMLSWIPLVTVLFRKVEPYKAAAIAFVLGLLFLPVAKIPMKGLPDLTKVTICCTAILIGAWIYDRDRLLSFKAHLVDIPMALWCTCPLFSSVANGLGVYDGLSETMYQSFTWGLPYLVARVYFSNLKGLNTLTITVFAGGLLYIPFCIEEIIMSPQLHRMVYGFHQHSFLQTMRGGGFRPMVFMEHGLMTAMWMISATMLGLWLAYSKVIPQQLKLIPFGNLLAKCPLWLLLLSLLVTTALMKSTGAFVLFVVGLSTLYLSQKLKTTLIVWFLLTLPPTYMISRSTGWWSGENLSTLVSEKFSARGGQSLQFRFDNEKILVEKALDGGFFGWGGWNRSRVIDENGKDISITDGLWIITLGTKGIYGLTLLTVVLSLPVLLLLYHSTPGQWKSKEWGSIAVMSILLLLYLIDNLPNGMVNPIFMLFNGSICGVLATQNVMSCTTDSLFSKDMSHAFTTRYINSAASTNQTRIITGTHMRNINDED